MQIYVVRQGDTVRQLAQRYRVDVSQITLANQLADPNVLVVGQALVIPNPAREYVVQPGDQLAGIADRYGVAIQDLAAANNIVNPALIFPGEVLVIPYFPYTVQAGDTLWYLADRYGTTANRIALANRINPQATIYPGQILRIPYDGRPIKEINGYTTLINERGAATVLYVGNSLTHVFPFAYNMRADGTITALEEGPILEAARTQNVTTLLVLTNLLEDKFNSDLAASVLRSPDVQEKLIDNLLRVIQEKGYKGINFDFEYVYPEDRENYNAFLRRVVARFRPRGLLVSTALAPKYRTDQPGLLYEAHDYKAQGEIVDFVVLMTYEWGWAGGRPLAISPIPNIRQILDYAVTVIPRNKISMGVSIYGRNWRIPWQQGTTAGTISPQEAVGLAARYGAVIEYNQNYQAPFFRYTDQTGQQHEVWFEDARSVQAKYDLVREYNLRGASYWDLRYAFPQNWAVVKNNFVVEKLQ